MSRYRLLFILLATVDWVSAFNTGIYDKMNQEIETLEEEIFALSDTLQQSKGLDALLANGTCPTYFTSKEYHCWSVDKRCYCIIDDLNTRQLTWWGALHFCRQYEMELLSLETETEEINLFSKFNATPGYRNILRYYLTSGNRLHGDRNTWMWAGSGILNREIKWRKNEPTITDGSKNEECLVWVHFTDKDNSSFQQNWMDTSCESSSLKHFICEFEMSPQII